jgi:hypothetical protein
VTPKRRDDSLVTTQAGPRPEYWPLARPRTPVKKSQSGENRPTTTTTATTTTATLTPLSRTDDDDDRGRRLTTTTTATTTTATLTPLTRTDDDDDRRRRRTTDGSAYGTTDFLRQTTRRRETPNLAMTSTDGSAFGTTDFLRQTTRLRQPQKLGLYGHHPRDPTGNPNRLKPESPEERLKRNSRSLTHPAPPTGRNRKRALTETSRFQNRRGSVISE